MRVNVLVLVWNAVWYLLAVFMVFLIVQHAVFIYVFPPDMSRVLDVHLSVYFILGIPLCLLLKFGHYVWERGEIFPSEEEE